MRTVVADAREGEAVEDEEAERSSGGGTTEAEAIRDARVHPRAAAATGPFQSPW
eukprot:CAMPEP_0183306404 /NCGR_PEP_ID=MMETSP0160_2-20130417/10948_1 /TAXON_ID=2839 ORGANISM="Odontella Sinensis, Strain Grunow 1884" /NCGR_SAMPLE_ID=MMETSP0160_2 /ASSEMBLY_ACC=CAM_ASM_000250 /LENGTH=53 /DNA_ID=CAMNT_0025469765 /DNA_START=52 /DNA_END=213 /DNA_ORIENTATION=-